MSQKYRKFSTFLAKILRHDPGIIGLQLDPHGWVEVDALLRGLQKANRQVTREILEEIVATDEKGRYSFSDDGLRIRANQGHSIAVEIEMTETEPPDVLYHGTATANLDQIFQSGLRPMSRLYVHLSGDAVTAVKVGRRHGNPIVLTVDCRAMRQAGYTFYLSPNGVWQVSDVPSIYLQILK